MIRTVYLHGSLADRFGKAPIDLDCNRLPLLMSGLESAHPGFRAALGGLPNLGIVKKTGDKLVALTDDTLAFDFGDAEELHVASSEAGSAAAAGYIAAAIAEYGTAAYWIAYAVAYVAITAIISYAVSSIVQSMSDVTSTDGKNAADARASSLFNGATNSREQGGAVPLLYGEFLVGGVVISGEIVSERIATAMNDYLKFTVGDAITGNVLGNDVLSSVLTVQSFRVGSTTYAAGATYTDANLSLSISSTGVVSGTTTGATELVVTYTAIDGTGLQTSARLTISVEFPVIEYSGGGGPGDGGD